MADYRGAPLDAHPAAMAKYYIGMHHFKSNLWSSLRRQKEAVVNQYKNNKPVYGFAMCTI
jgi:hypothetical protein